MDATDYLIMKLAIDYFVKNPKQTRRFSIRQMEKKPLLALLQAGEEGLATEG